MSKIERLLLVDPITNQRAPSMRAWLQVAKDVLPMYFKEVEIWSMECELDVDWVKWRKFPKVGPFWPIQCSVFRPAVRLAHRHLPKSYFENTLVQVTGELLPKADIRYIHFWNIAFAQIGKEKPKEMRIRLRDIPFRDQAIRSERKSLQSGATGEWWCVSRGIAERIAAPKGSVFRYLPNSYDPVRFNPSVRSVSRVEARKYYGYVNDEIVLTFCSFGHFVRKGLLQAVQTVNRLNQAGHPVRLLVLGGTDGSIRSFRRLLASKSESVERVQFAGLVSPPEWHLSAGEALIFPSHFEAFSLVEIEAAALGLRLYLTAHPGSEMIMREGINGRLLPWDVEGMVATLAADILSGDIHKAHNELGEALSPAAYAELLSKLYAEAIQRKLQA